MLLLTRKPGQSFYMDDNEGNHIEIFLNSIKGNQARIGIKADTKFKILRDDVIKREKKS